MLDALQHESFANFLGNHWLFILFWAFVAYEVLKSIAKLFRDDPANF